ncbi:TolC family protein [Parabacteroides sp. APC149_11_2_Y6]
MKIILVIISLLWGTFCIAQENPAIITKDSSSSNLPSDGVSNYEQIELPPLSIFLESVYEHPSVKVYEAQREEEEANLSDTKKKWMNYLRVAGYYQYGQLSSLSKTPEADNLAYVLSNKLQNQYNIGLNLSIPLGDLAGQKQRVRAKKARIRQIEYASEINIEERKLRILEAYNKVVEQLATLKAKSDAAALYNAQMKITEQDFIDGTIDISTLSIERSRRTRAVVEYQEGRAALHNAITLLEMLTNVKVINK